VPTAATKFGNILCGRKDIIKIGIDISKGGVVHDIVKHQAFCSQSCNKSSSGTKQTTQKQRFPPYTLHHITIISAVLPHFVPCEWKRSIKMFLVKTLLKPSQNAMRVSKCPIL